jgi:hypothetical protein
MSSNLLVAAPQIRLRPASVENHQNPHLIMMFCDGVEFGGLGLELIGLCRVQKRLYYRTKNNLWVAAPYTFEWLVFFAPYNL